MTGKEQEEIARLAFSAISVVLFGTIFVVASTLATRLAWNMVAPDVFGLPPLTTKNALGLVGLGVMFRFFSFSRRSEK